MKVLSFFIISFILASVLFFQPVLNPKLEVSKKKSPIITTTPEKISNTIIKIAAQPCIKKENDRPQTLSISKESALIISTLINPYGNQFSPVLVSTVTSRMNRRQKDELDDKQLNTQQLTFSDNILSEIGNHYSKLVQREPLKKHTKEYWKIVHSIESKQGKLLYRPKNHSKSCANTQSPCGHHQLNVQALKDIGCTSPQCRIDREDYKKSLAMSIKLQALNHKRISKNGYEKIAEYQSYLIHQQGATGARIIFDASIGKKLISKNIRRNMANNSPFSYKQLLKMGSKLAANKFLQHWEKKWQKEIILISKNDNQNAAKLPTLNKYQLRIALNMQF